MNNQAIINNGYYLHYKKKLYRLINIAHGENNEEFVIYQPQYGESVLWQRPKEMFFEDIDFEGRISPRFTFLGKNLVEAEKTLKQMNIQISPAPIIRDKSMLDEQPIQNESFIIRGFATHSETLVTQIIYTKKSDTKLMTLPADKFMKLLHQTTIN